MSEAQVDRVCEALAAALGQPPARDNRPLDVPLPQRPRPALLAAQPLDRVRLAAGALRHRPVAGPRPGAAARSACSSEDELEQIDAGLERVGARDGARAVRVRGRPTRTSTWRSSGARRGDRARSPASSTPAARATTRSRPTWRWSSSRTRCGRSSCCGAVMERLLELAERHRDWPMPGYTHLQRAQPVYLGHHLLAYFWMLGRDVLRFQFALDSAGVMPLGSGALAGVNWEIDRRAVADDLGFEHVSANSIDGASNRDFVLDYLVGGLDLRDAPLAARRRRSSSGRAASSASASSTSPSPRAPRSCRRRRTPTRPSCCAPRRRGSPPSYAALLGRRCTRCRSPTARTCRRTRSRCSTRSTRSSSCLDATEGMLAGIELRPRAPRGGLRRRDAGRDRDRRPAGPQGRALPRGARDRRRPGPRRGRAAASSLSELTREELRQPLRAPRRLLLRGAAARAAGWSRSGSRAGPARRSLARQIELARETLAAVRARVVDERS